MAVESPIRVDVDFNQICLQAIKDRAKNPHSGIQVGVAKFPGEQPSPASPLPIFVDATQIAPEVPIMETTATQIAESVLGNSEFVLDLIGTPDFLIDDTPLTYTQRFYREYCILTSQKRRSNHSRRATINEQRIALAANHLGLAVLHPDLKPKNIGLLTAIGGSDNVYEVYLSHGARVWIPAVSVIGETVNELGGPTYRGRKLMADNPIPHTFLV